jgi:O-antigen ligase
LTLTTKTQAIPNEQDEIGHPALSKQATTTIGSGRLAAWEGAAELIGDRPILGYGFGTEQKVFIDRWYFFEGGTTENSYLGLLLEVGAIGLALVLAMGCALAVGGFRALRVRDGEDRVLVVAGLGVLAAAAVIMLIQSYLYSVGNVATATVWISLFTLAPIALAPRIAPARIRAVAPEVIS